MDKVIYKYPVDLLEAAQGKFYLTPPKGYTVLSFQMQGQVPTVWMEVNPEAPLDKVRAKIRGSGHKFEKTQFDRYIGTVQEGHDGRSGFVWHLYLEDGEICD